MDEKLSIMEFLEKHHDGAFEFRYQTMKDAVFAFYCWGWHEGNVDAMEFYRDICKLYRKYDDKFVRADGDK
ncbi:MAG: hypothetical protein OXI30_19570 [Chloroflexota bacterium]|nr:hypothetical protein [Chloroflexota bacterium]